MPVNSVLWLLLAACLFSNSCSNTLPRIRGQFGRALSDYTGFFCANMRYLCVDEAAQPLGFVCVRFDILWPSLYCKPNRTIGQIRQQCQIILPTTKFAFPTSDSCYGLPWPGSRSFEHRLSLLDSGENAGKTISINSV